MSVQVQARLVLARLVAASVEGPAAAFVRSRLAGIVLPFARNPAALLARRSVGGLGPALVEIPPPLLARTLVLRLRARRIFLRLAVRTAISIARLPLRLRTIGRV
jgi:hypothetical protein